MYAHRLPARLLKTLPGRLVLGLIVFALLLRAAVPAGFMLDASASRSHTLMLTLCSAGGVPIVVPMDLSERDDHSTQDVATAADCPLGAHASQVILSQAGEALSPARQLTSAPYAAIHKAAPALPAVGPPLGSRAPPAHLV